VKFISYRKSVKSHSQMKDLNKLGADGESGRVVVVVVVVVEYCPFLREASIIFILVCGEDAPLHYLLLLGDLNEK
jgi:hypothetical protein